GEGIATTILKRLGIDPQKLAQRIVTKITDPANYNKMNEEEKETPNLDKYTIDLNKMAQNGEIDPVIGRSKEIERVIQVLSRRTKNNPVLIGEPGVGKTAIIEGLAQKIVEGTVPEVIKDKRILTLDLPGLIAGAKYR
ncbi:ATP-dependent Clp protease ATP-binding subunit, partial [Vibrio parahaemolyticus]|nr:ATP-dependent Clp protease ATP-binding subunit [Vibrio parahaemolyticus]